MKQTATGVAGRKDDGRRSIKKSVSADDYGDNEKSPFSPKNNEFVT